MLIDRKGKIFGKVSIIDLFVLMLILVTLGGAYYKFSYMKGTDDVVRMDTIEYKVLVSGIRKMSVDALKPQVDVFESKTDIHIGKVESKEVLPAMDYIIKTDGTIVKAEKPERYDMIITIVSPGIENNNSFLANGSKEIKIGSDLEIKTQLNLMQTKIVDVRKIKK